MRVPPSTSLPTLVKSARAVDASEVAQQVSRMARLPVLPIIASKCHARAMDGGDGPGIVEEAIAALVGKVIFGNLDTLKKLALEFKKHS